MLAMGSFFSPAFFRPVVNSLSSRSKSQCSAPATFTAAIGETVEVFERNFAAIERAQNDAAAVRAEVTSEIMSCHKEIRPQFKASASGVKKIGGRVVN